jgi:diguanylate cyclase (GGDEF)-like protein
MSEINPDQKNSQLISQINMIAETGRALTSTFNMNEVLHQIINLMAGLLKIESWSLMLIDEETDELYFEISIEEDNGIVKNLRFNKNEGIAGWVMKEKEILIISDVIKDERFTGHVDRKTDFTTKSIVAVPLLFREEAIGVIELINLEDINAIDDTKLTILSILADFAAIAISNARNYQQINMLSITDDLTGLYNSRYLHTLLEKEFSRCFQKKMPITLIFMDIDHFKRVNDTYGHLAGSAALSEFGDVIKSVLRSGDNGARYGGDEYIMILPETSKQEAIEIVQILRRKIKEKNFLVNKGFDIKLTASFGLATFPDDVDSKDEAIRLADKLMYKVKESSRDGIASL